MALAAGYNNALNLNTMQYGQQPIQQVDNMVWVKGPNEANAYPVTPGTSKTLYDSENPVFYIKSVDLSGMPMPLRIFDYKERKGDVKGSTDDTVSKSDFDKFKSEILDILKKNNNYYPKKPQNKEEKVNA